MTHVTPDPCDGATWPPKYSGVLSPTLPRAVNPQKTPGPIYKLPCLVGYVGHDPRSVHPVGPAYTIKGRNVRLKEMERSPGPIYLPRYKNCQTGYTMRSRPRERPVSEGPGPAAYLVLPEKGCYNGITMKRRPKDNPCSEGPGPAAYKLPPTLGCHISQPLPSAPCYSITGKPRNLFRSLGPGPGAYTIVSDCCYKPCPPKYTIGARVYPPPAGTKTPGPGTYCPEKVRYLPEAPHYSFGIRWCEKANKEILDKEPQKIEDECPLPCC